MNKAKDLVQMIRSALHKDADDLLRQRASQACDQLLVVLAAEPGKPMPVAAPAQPVQPVPVAPAAQPVPPVPVAQPPGLPPATQMLELLIAKLKSELPREDQATELETSKELRIPYVPIPGRLGAGS